MSSIVVLIVGPVMITTVALLVVDATPSMAKDTASAEPAGGAEKATTVRPEALGPRAGNRALRWRPRGDVKGVW